jgi:hypothetical protein
MGAAATSGMARHCTLILASRSISVSLPPYHEDMPATAMFDRLDRDHDGTLDRRELRGAAA